MLSNFIPMDRLQALSIGDVLPDRMVGSALSADVSGYVALAGRLADTLGPQRGAEELTRLLNLAFETLVAEVDQYRGGVVSFVGDAIVCWFGGDDGSRATACALGMQEGMAKFSAVPVISGDSISFSVKAAVAVGPIRRFQVGNPEQSYLDAIGGLTIDRLAAADRLASGGEVILDHPAASTLGANLIVMEWRTAPYFDAPFAVIKSLLRPVDPTGWPSLPSTGFPEEIVRGWLLPPVYERLHAGLDSFLAELRPATALFVRWHGIDFDSDPDAHSKLDAFVRWVQSVLVRFAGSLLNVTLDSHGGWLLCSFGAPLAHADDIMRAAAAAVEIRHTSHNLTFIRSVRMGMCAGRVYAGAYGSSTSRTYGILGDIVNIAARLMQMASDGQILLNDHLGTSVSRRFNVAALEPMPIKGKADPLRVCELLEPKDHDSIALLEPQCSTPIIGREAELSLIDEKLAKALVGKGQVITIAGEPGLGKSRLMAEAIVRSNSAGLAPYGGASQLFEASTAYLVWRPIWHSLFGLSPQMTHQEQLSRVETILAAIDPALVLRIPLLSPILGLTIDENDFTRSLPGPVRKEMLEAVLISFIQAKARVQPILLVIEDAQWMDSLSKDLLEAVSRSVEESPVLLLAAYRLPVTDWDPSDQLRTLPHYTPLTLHDMNETEVVQLIDLKVAQLFGVEQAPRALIERVLERSHGNPFYIEELLNYLHERRVDLSNVAALEGIEPPHSLHSLILDRIDRLTDTEQITLKVASVIGRRFVPSWLWGAHPDLGESGLIRGALEVLSRLDLTPLDSSGSELAYLFKHRITQEVAYESLTYSTRERLHEQLAGFIEAAILPSEEPPLDLLAYHYRHSANRPKEVLYSLKAGELAVKNGAYREALNYLNRALEIVLTTPEFPDKEKQELSLQLNLGGVLLVTQGQGSIEAKAAFDRAWRLSQRLERSPALPRVLFGLWTYYLFQGAMETATQIAEQSVALAQQEQDQDALLHAHFAVSATVYWLGEFARTVEHAEHVIALYDPAEHQAYITRYAQNPRITAMADATWSLWVLGYPDQAQQRTLEVEALAKELAHEFSIVISLHIAPILYYHTRQVDLLSNSLPEYLNRAAGIGNPVYINIGLALQGWLNAAQGRHSDGFAQLKQARDTLLAMGVAVVDPMIGTMLVDACLLAGEIEQGLSLLDEMMERMVANEQRAFLAEQHRFNGELLLARSTGQANAAGAKAERCFVQAIEVARQQSARSFELRAVLSLGRLWHKQGKGSEAKALLEPLFNWFSEGMDTPDLQDAARLLQEWG